MWLSRYVEGFLCWGFGYGDFTNAFHIGMAASGCVEVFVGSAILNIWSLLLVKFEGGRIGKGRVMCSVT